MNTSMKHYLDFLCEGWVGNFELEFVSYVFNEPDWENEDRDFSIYLTEAEKAETLELIGEDALEHSYGEYGLSHVELNECLHPGNDRLYNSIRVQIRGEAWGEGLSSEAVELLKARAKSFFIVYLENLPPYQKKEGAFVDLAYTVETVSTEEPVLL